MNFSGCLLQKNIRIRIFIVLLLSGIGQVTAQQKDSVPCQSFEVGNGITYEYTKPVFFDMLRYIPKDVGRFGHYLVQKENLLWVGLSVGSTAAIIPFDDHILEGASNLGSHIGWDKDPTYDTLFGFLNVIPNDLNAAVYYIGNGGTTLLLSGGFYVFGKINNNYRALNVANELVEVLLSVGVVTQTIKRITGRQSPQKAIATGHPTGHWTLFPSFKKYQQNTPNYDAMPSGHVATFMATLMVIATNYPEVKWIKPVGYSLLAITAFEMVSAKVHWVSDYPIGLLIGYVMGKTVAERRIHKKTNDITASLSKKIRYETNFSFNRIDGINVVGVTITF